MTRPVRATGTFGTLNPMKVMIVPVFKKKISDPTANNENSFLFRYEGIIMFVIPKIIDPTNPNSQRI